MSLTESQPKTDRLAPQRPDQLPALNGARGLAVLFVLLDHASDTGLLLHPAWNFNRAGRYGVLLFFSLSAFLLTYLFFIQAEANLRSTRHWLNYVVRRFLRIYPLYFLVLVVWALERENIGPSDVINHLLLRDGQRHFWTIAVEVKYYAVLPLLVLVYPVLWRRNKWASLLAGLGIFAVLRFALEPLEAAWSLTDDIWLNEFMEVFLLGSLSGFVYAEVVRRKIDLRRFRWILEAVAWACLAVAIIRIPSVYIAIFHPGAEDVKMKDTTDIFATVWAVFLFATLRGAGWMGGILSVAPLQNLGRISYSAYLWHPFLLSFAEDLPFPPWLRLISFVTAVILASIVSYLLIERPLSRVRLAT